MRFLPSLFIAAKCISVAYASRTSNGQTPLGDESREYNVTDGSKLHTLDGEYEWELRGTLPSSTFYCPPKVQKETLSKTDVINALDRASNVYYNKSRKNCKNPNRVYPKLYSGYNGVNFPDCPRRNNLALYEFPILKDDTFCAQTKKDVGIYRVVYTEGWSDDNHQEPRYITYCGVIYHRDKDFAVCHPKGM